MPAAVVGAQPPRLHRDLPGDAEGGLSPAPDRDPGALQAAQRGRHPGLYRFGEWRGKAGGYAVQGIAGSFVVKIVGSYTSIVGLPLFEIGHAAWAARVFRSAWLAECQLAAQRDGGPGGGKAGRLKAFPICGKPAVEATSRSAPPLPGRRPEPLTVRHLRCSGPEADRRRRIA